MTVNINAANISSVQLAAAQTPSAPNTGFVRLHHNANSRLAMRPSTGNVVEFLGNTSGSGAGITFPNSVSTSTTTLDWYEEGTFTANYAVTGGSLTMDTSLGVFTRIGRVVYITVRVTTASISSPTGSVTITGLPYLAANVSGQRFGLSIGDKNRWATDMPNLTASILENTQIIQLFKQASNETAGSVAVVGTDLASGSSFNRLTLSGFYYA